MNTSSIIVLLCIVLIVYTTLLPFSNAYHKRCLIERFSMEPEAPLEWTQFNTLSRRGLAFRPPHITANASQRAENNKAFVFDHTANCASPIIPQNINNNAQSLVADNEILYKLTSSCFSFKANQVQSQNNLPLNIQNKADWFKYVYLMLLNPVFIEVNKDNHTNISFAYFIDNKTPKAINNKGFGDFAVSSLSQYTGTNATTISLKQLTDASIFNYRDKQPTYKSINNLGINNDNAINIKAFYTRPYESSQTVGNVVSFANNNPSNRFLVSSTSYNTMQNTDANKAIKLLSNTIDRFYNSTSRSLFPTFTISFKINLNTNNSIQQQVSSRTKYMALEMFMNNELGMSMSCNNNNVYPPNFARNGNIVSLAVEYLSHPSSQSSQSKLIKLSMGSSIGGCLFLQGQSIDVHIPVFAANNTEANCTLTISPYVIDFLAIWVNPEATQKQDNVEFVYQQKTLPQGTMNDFHRLFVGPNTSPSTNRFADIIVNTNTEVVSGVQEVQLGYKNMAEILYRAIHQGQQ